MGHGGGVCAFGHLHAHALHHDHVILKCDCAYHQDDVSENFLFHPLEFITSP